MNQVHAEIHLKKRFGLQTSSDEKVINKSQDQT